MTPATSEDYRSRITRLIGELADLKQAYELEQEQNILLAQKCSDYADIVTSLEQRLKNSNDRHAEREKEVEFWKDAYNESLKYFK